MNGEESANRILPQIDHFVVVMFENRSFDNMLGGLYPELTKQGKYEGVKNTMYNLKDPMNAESERIRVWQAKTGYEGLIPYPDPGESFDDMNQQIFSPNKAPPTGPGTPTMNGFVANYLAQGGDEFKAHAVMQYYAPDAGGYIPITSTLAKNYAVSDFWHASAPVQTLVNRTFVHSGQPSTYVKHGKVYNRVNNESFFKEHLDPDGRIDVPTIFERLDTHLHNGRTNWKVYYHDWPLSAMFKYVNNHWKFYYHFCPLSAMFKYVSGHWNKAKIFDCCGDNVYQYQYHHKYPKDYADFAYDVNHNSLPTYSFIEPRYTNAFCRTPNSNHPGGATYKKGAKRNGPPPISVFDGELLLKDIYTKLASDPALFEKTLLIVTYDEHGGLFDHVPPPAAQVPVPNRMAANFDYSRFGVRVPAIFINPYIKPGTIFRPKSGPIPFDHTSIISTLRKRFGLGKALTARDEVAPTFDGVLNSTTKNPFGPSQLPTLGVPEVAAGKGDNNNLGDFIFTEMRRGRNAQRVKFIAKAERAAGGDNDRE